MSRFHEPSYWDGRKQTKTDTEWLCSYETLKPLLKTTISNNKRCAALVVGSGASTFPEELYDGGVNDVMVVDFSKEAYEDMHCRNADARPGLHIKQVDIADEQALAEGHVGYDLVVDKGTIDCILSQSGGYPRAVSAIQLIFSRMKTPGTLILVSHSPLADRKDFLQTVYWHETKVYAIRPASLEDLIEDKAKERELQELVNGDEVPYEPGVTYVYQLLK